MTEIGRGAAHQKASICEHACTNNIPRSWKYTAIYPKFKLLQGRH
jgi:hypothetical protein